MRLLGDKDSKKSPKKKRESIFGQIWRGSPGRGELPKPYSTKAEKRVMKRRAHNTQKQLRRRRRSYVDADSDEEQKDNKKDDQKANSANGSSWNVVASVFTYIESHPQLPHILSFYAQLLLNLFLVFSCMYILYSFWSTIVSDVDKKSEEAVAEALAEMAVCAKNYRENGCEDRRAPALEQVCLSWEKCMARDPKSVGRARVSAHTFAEIFNSFIEPISYKAMVCTHHVFTDPHVSSTNSSRFSLSSSSSHAFSSPTSLLASSATRCTGTLTYTIHHHHQPHSAIRATHSWPCTHHTTTQVFLHYSHLGINPWDWSQRRVIRLLASRVRAKDWSIIDCFESWC